MNVGLHLFPLEADLKIMVELDQVEQVIEDYVRLVLGDADDALSKVRRDEHRLPASNRVGSTRWSA